MTKQSLNHDEVRKYLRHRPPILLVDEVIDLEPSESATGILRLTEDSPCFAGHFPGNPVMPGVLIIEALAQSAAVMVLSKYYQQANEEDKPTVYFASIKGAKFRKMVVPGDILHLKTKTLHSLRRGKDLFWRVEAKAYVKDDLVTDAELTAVIRYT